jgi:S-adenosylmethionine-diacylgycerolhomoserine-N-methlytransferase
MSGNAAVLMDRMYRRKRHVYDISRKFYLLGRDSLIRELQPPVGGSVLEIGCGTARNLVLAADAWPRALFHGVDVSEQMLLTARRSIAVSGHVERIRVAAADARDLDAAALFGVERFDRVFFSYTLSMIPDWRRALDRAFDLVAPHGSLHVVDFGDFGGLPRWFDQGINRWLAAFSVEPRPDLEEAVEALAARAGATSRVVRRFRGYALHAVVVAQGRPAGVRAHESNVCGASWARVGDNAAGGAGVEVASH